MLDTITLDTLNQFIAQHSHERFVLGRSHNESFSHVIMVAGDA
jgi:hypothetical protein